MARTDAELIVASRDEPAAYRLRRGPDGVLLDNLNVTTFSAEGRWYGPGA